MKILLVHNDYQQAGGERVAVQAQITLLKQRGHRVIPFLINNQIIEQYTWLQKAAFFPNTVYSQHTYRALRTLVQSEQPDVAHVHNVFPLLSPAVYLSLSDAGIPIVQTIHNFRFMCPNSLFHTHEQVCERCKDGNTLPALHLRCYRDSYLLSGLYALTIGLHRRLGTFQKINHFLALTSFSARKLVESGLATPEKITVLGNFLPDPLPTRGPTTRQAYVVYLGRLSPEKGVATLVRAMQGLSYLKAKICGAGEQQADLESLVQELSLNNIEFVGYVSGEAKWELLRNATATIIPSVWYEHLPFSMLESWAVGTPVIASDLGSMRDLLNTQQEGLMFPAGDYLALRSRLKMMSQQLQAGLLMGEQGRRRIEAEFCETVHYSALVRVYQQLAIGR
jgi:glycosyltransferase involved in cell wall biosynthesis